MIQFLAYLEHKRIDLLAYILIRELIIFFISLQQQIEKSQSLFHTEAIFLFRRSIISCADLFSLEGFLSITDDLSF